MKSFITLLFSTIFSFGYSQFNEWTWLKGTNTPSGTAVQGTQGVPAINNTPPSCYEAVEWTDNNGNFWVLTENGAFWKYDPIINMWTWVRTAGTNYGVQGIPSPTSFPGGHGFGALTWTDNTNNLWLYAGVAWGWDDNLWRYNIATNQWTWMKGIGAPACATRVYGTLNVPAITNTPGARAETSSSWKDATGNLWFYGGQACTGNASSSSTAGALSDIWMYDIGTNIWIWKSGSQTNNQAVSHGTQGVAAATNSYGARFTYASGQQFNGSVLFHGGASATGTSTLANNYNNDIFKYTIASNQWTWLNGPSASGQAGIYGTKCVPSTTNRPGHGYETRVRWSDDCGNLWIWGSGPSTSSVLASANDLWRYSLKNNTWTWVNGTNLANQPGVFGTQGVSSAANIPPSGIVGGNPFKYKTALYFFSGGNVFNNTAFNTLWKYEPDKPVAAFTLAGLVGCVPVTASFTNSSTPGCNEIKDFLWNFGDPGSGLNDTSSLENPTHIYGATGNYTVQLIVTNCTGSKDTTSLPVAITSASVTSTQNPVICTGASFTLPDGSSVNTAGTYTDTLLSSKGCDSIITTNLTLTNTLTSSQNPIICSGNSFTLPDGSSTSIAGTFTDTLTSFGGCDSVITTSLTLTPAVTLSQSATICIGSSYTLPGGNIVSTTGAYIDTLSTTSGCDSIVTTNLSVLQNITSAQNQVICNGQSYTLPGGGSATTAGIYTDTLLAFTGCDSIITTTLTILQNANSSQNPIICANSSYTLPNGNNVNVSGTYLDTLTSFNGCDSIITITLIVNPTPTAGVSPDVTIVSGNNTTLTATGGGSYNWAPTTGLNNTNTNTVTASPTVTTTYCVIVTDNNGCIDTACVTVEVETPCTTLANLNVPNAFSPNSDNINDEFCLQGWDACIKEFNIVIYDRWGEKVFESKEPDFCWDGKHKGKKMDAAVFVYYIKALFLNQETLINKKGNISLIR